MHSKEVEHRPWSVTDLKTQATARVCMYSLHNLFLTLHFEGAFNSAYKEPAYKELPVTRDLFILTNLYQGTSSLYMYFYEELRL